MTHRFGIRPLALALALVFSSLWAGSALPARAAAHRDHIVFAGGCFWGVQAVFEAVRGVTNTTAGYAGGNAATAHYEIVSTGLTGHAESVDVEYDPSQIALDRLLDVFFMVAHDPTELNYQGPDEGSQYRSEIFFTTPAQRDASLAYIAQLRAKKVFKAPIVTKVEPLKGFYAAEEHHQHFIDRNPDDSYIVVNDLPKLRDLRARFPQIVARTKS